MITQPLRRQGTMTILARCRRRIQRLGPYQSLALMALPTALVEPLKLIAVMSAGKGHWLASTAMILVAYGASFLFIERLFRVLKPKLMMLSWFADLWTRFAQIRNRVCTYFKSANSKHSTSSG